MSNAREKAFDAHVKRLKPLLDKRDLAIYKLEDSFSQAKRALEKRYEDEMHKSFAIYKSECAAIEASFSCDLPGLDEILKAGGSDTSK